jgi:imidazolonepropionase-like amidohydrolase
MADRFGSVEPGKVASLILVEGDASQDMGALRRVATVFLDGYRLDAGELRKASGFGGMPK